MAKYVDGFVFVVQNDKTEEYIKMAEEGAKFWKRHGALEYFECRGDDLIPKAMGDDMPLAFSALANAKADETVWFSFIIFKSKQHRDEVNAKVNEEMEKDMEKYKDQPMPFDTKRMAYGGFEVLVEG